MKNVIYPPEIVSIDSNIIFLAGPIQGACQWQDKAITIIHTLNDKIVIANPRRRYLDGEFVYNAQVDWETHFLQQATEKGTVLFWLAKEYEHICTRAYAQTSRFELGEWKTKHEYSGANLIVGIEEGFTNAKYIKRRLSQDCPRVPICSSLKQSCQKAVELLAL